MTEPLVAALGERRPAIDPVAFLASGCFVLGDARIGARAGVWYGTVVRADAETITVGDETNLQDGVVVHADPGFPCHIGARVSVGHRAVVHGCTVGDDVLVGMGATILNGARIGSWSLIAAGAVVLQNTEIPEGSLVAGVPGKVVRTLGEQERQAITRNAQVYLHLADEHRTITPVPR
jgi:carbonic anhydrase/acetyltransferase-like protein (isoleucine patch superfamily)